MKIKTSELTGAALNWAVAKCEGWESGKYMMAPDIRKDVRGNVIGIKVPSNREYIWWNPATDWSQGGPIIEREGLTLTHQGTRWGAQTDDDLFAYGPTPLIAAMRCYVASKLGDNIDIPEKLQ